MQQYYFVPVRSVKWFEPVLQLLRDFDDFANYLCCTLRHFLQKKTKKNDDIRQSPIFY